MDPRANIDQEIENWFTYHAPTDEQRQKLIKVRDKAKELAYIIRENAPKCPDQTAALRKLREAVMTANAAIVIPQPEAR